jgi:exopolyphosphatase / guanosine-5'-triphosphate,3'-diphosphate pyrophosphatase
MKNSKIIPLLNEYRIPRIGKNLNETGKFSEESIERLKEVLLNYKKLSEDYGATVILASATAAFRNATNSDQVKNHIYTETGINIKVISGETEAQYAYLGVADGSDDTRKKMVLDVGGGSTEIILGRSNKILFRKSFDTGVVFSSELFRNSGNYLEDLKNYYKSIFAEVKLFRLYPDYGYAIAGTPTTISAINLKLREFDADKIEGSLLSTEDINKFIEDYSASPGEYNENYKKILTGREDLIIPGSLILLRLMQNLGLKNVRVSTRGIRHGAVINYLKNQG